MGTEKLARFGIVMPLAEQRGGAEMALLHLLEADARRPYHTYSVAFLEEGPMLDRAAALGYATTVVPAGRLRNVGRFLSTVHRLRHWMLEHEFDGVLSWMAKAHLYAGPAARTAGLPAFWWQHGLSSGHWIDRLATRLPAGGVFACSRAAAAAQARLRPHRPVRVIYPAVDLERFSAPALQSLPAVRRKLGLPEEAHIVGIVARLEPLKGVHRLIEAARPLSDRFPDLLVVVVGGAHSLEPEYAAWIRQYTDGLGLRDRVLFAGHQPDVPAWMMAMDVVVNASHGEAFGIVLVEAMALGKPLVAFRSGGPAEIAEHNRTALLVEPDRPEELVAALHRLLSDPALRERLGAAARVRAQDFGTARFAREVAGALEAAAAA